VRKGRSCSSVVLAKETAEQVTSAHPACLVLSDDGQPGRWIRRLEPQRPMRTVLVVVLDIDSQDLRQMPSSDNQEPVQALGTDGADPSFGERVRLRRSHRRHQHLAILRAEYLVEPAGELRVSVANQEPYRSSSLAQHQHQVASLLGDPAAIRMGRHAAEVNPSGVAFNEGVRDASQVGTRCSQRPRQISAAVAR
jgi:hypothetical protein